MSLSDMIAQSRKLKAGQASVDFSSRGHIVLPLLAYYGKNPDQMKKRAEFYYYCAQVFEFENWHTKPEKPSKAPIKVPGRDGALSLIEKYGHFAIATFRDNMAHPVEYFEASKLLDDQFDKDAPEKTKDMAKDAGVRRTRFARIYFDICIGAEVSGLASSDLTGMPTGHGGARAPADMKIDCMKRISRWEAEMPKPIRSQLDRILYKGSFEFLRAKKKETQFHLAGIQMGLDIIANIEREMSFDELLDRWDGLEAWHIRRHAENSGTASYSAVHKARKQATR